MNAPCEQHNLAGNAMALDVPELCWSVAQGVHLSLDLSGSVERANTSWVAVVGDFQRVLLSRFADYQGTLSLRWDTLPCFCK